MTRFIALWLLFLQLALGPFTLSHLHAAGNDLDPRLAGYPTATFHISPEGIEAPDHVAAGPTIVVQENSGDQTGHFFIARIPDDVTEADVQAFTAPETAPLAVNPEPPAWLFRSLFAGNPDRAAPSGEPVAGLVDLVSGRYLVLDPYRPPAEGDRFDVEPGVTGENAMGGLPDADVTVRMYEMDFDLPATVPAGPQIWEVVNSGTALHEIALLPVPADATSKEVEAVLMAALHAEAEGEPFDGQTAPAEMGASWDDWRLQLVHGVGVMSPGRSALASFDLEPGTYAAVCFVPDPVTGTPHLMMGMTEIFTVTDGARATPAA